VQVAGPAKTLDEIYREEVELAEVAKETSTEISPSSKNQEPSTGQTEPQTSTDNSTAHISMTHNTPSTSKLPDKQPVHSTPLHSDIIIQTANPRLSDIMLQHHSSSPSDDENEHGNIRSISLSDEYVSEEPIAETQEEMHIRDILNVPQILKPMLTKESLEKSANEMEKFRMVNDFADNSFVSEFIQYFLHCKDNNLDFTSITSYKEYLKKEDTVECFSFQTKEEKRKYIDQFLVQFLGHNTDRQNKPPFAEDLAKGEGT